MKSGRKLNLTTAMRKDFLFKLPLIKSKDKKTFADQCQNRTTCCLAENELARSPFIDERGCVSDFRLREPVFYEFQK